MLVEFTAVTTLMNIFPD